MGKSDSILKPWYMCHIKPVGEVALLGFTNNSWFDGDLYDLGLDNWQINSNWKLDKKYDTIISLRCPYFSKDPQDFIKICSENLKPGGNLYVDWGLGDHWRFENYKIGWIKDGEHEYAYQDDNFLWSTIWDDSFLKNSDFQKFSDSVKKFGYYNIKKSIFQEVPNILTFEEFEKYFNLKNHKILKLWTEFPQLYILLHGVKK